MQGTVGICTVLLEVAPQLRNVGSFNPKKLDPEWKDWLMRAERVFIDTFGGDFKAFFGSIAFEYRSALEAREDPEKRIMDWILGEIAKLPSAKQQVMRSS